MLVGRPDWMHRNHQDYDPNLIGTISEAQVVAALVKAGKKVWLPHLHVSRCDLILEDQGQLFRVQCKTGHLFRGAMCFATQSLRAAKRETEWRRIAFDYQGQIDYFGVYCPDNGIVYLVPIVDVPNKRICSLRIEQPRNNQKKRIRWAKEYEVKPLRLDHLGP